MTDNTPQSIEDARKRTPQDAYKFAQGIIGALPDTYNRCTLVACEVIRLHDALMAWRDELRRQPLTLVKGQIAVALDYSSRVDERDLDETWLEAGEVVERLTGILAGEGLD